MNQVSKYLDKSFQIALYEIQRKRERKRRKTIKTIYQVNAIIKIIKGYAYEPVFAIGKIMQTVVALNLSFPYGCLVDSYTPLPGWVVVVGHTETHTWVTSLFPENENDVRIYKRKNTTYTHCFEKMPCLRAPPETREEMDDMTWVNFPNVWGAKSYRIYLEDLFDQYSSGLLHYSFRLLLNDDDFKIIYKDVEFNKKSMRVDTVEELFDVVEKAYSSMSASEYERRIV